MDMMKLKASIGYFDRELFTLIVITALFTGDAGYTMKNYELTV